MRNSSSSRILLSVFILLVLFSFSTIAQNTFRKCYSSGHMDYSHNLVELKDGSYFIIGATYKPSQGTSVIHIVKLDSLGKIIWSKEYDHKDWWGYRIAVVSKSDMGLVIMTRDAHLFKMDTAGNVLWANKYNAWDRFHPMDLKETEDRGFIIAGILADKLGIGFIPIRKPGKLPFETISHEYKLEYGTDKVEVHKDAIRPGDKILLVDDLVATSGTALASCNLIEKLGGKVEECAFIIELDDLGGRKKLEDKGHKVFSIINFEGK